MDELAAVRPNILHALGSIVTKLTFGRQARDPSYWSVAFATILLYLSGDCCIKHVTKWIHQPCKRFKSENVNGEAVNNAACCQRKNECVITNRPHGKQGVYRR